MEEIWKEIDNYRVSSLGKIISNRGNKELKMLYVKGYNRVNLSKNGKVRQTSVHRLVAEAFILNTEKKPFVNHKNGIKDDNRVENLEWTTAKENIRHAWDTGLCKSYSHRIEKVIEGIKKNRKVVIDLEMGIFYDSSEDAAYAKGINKSTIRQYLSGKRKNKTSFIYA